MGLPSLQMGRLTFKKKSKSCFLPLDDPLETTKPTGFAHRSPHVVTYMSPGVTSRGRAISGVGEEAQMWSASRSEEAGVGRGERWKRAWASPLYHAA